MTASGTEYNTNSRRLPPLLCPTCMADPSLQASARKWLAVQRPGVTYRCGECGDAWLSIKQTPQTVGSIDWSRPDELPPGTYRCDRGWESGGYQFGCLERATTDVQSEDIDSGTVYTEHLCTDHALIQSLTGIQNALQHGTESTCRVADDLAEQVSTVTEPLWDINYTLMPLYRKIWMWVRGWYWERAHRRMWRRNHQSKAEFEQEEFTRNAVRAWLKHPTPSNAERAVQRLTMHADAGAAQALQAFIDSHDSHDSHDDTSVLDDAQAFIESHDKPEMRR